MITRYTTGSSKRKRKVSATNALCSSYSNAIYLVSLFSYRTRMPYTEITRTAGVVAAGIQNRRVISVGYRICYRTHKSVGYCGTTVTEGTEV